jgi:hypothetical protein
VLLGPEPLAVLLEVVVVVAAMETCAAVELSSDRRSCAACGRTDVG